MARARRITDREGQLAFILAHDRIVYVVASGGRSNKLDQEEAIPLCKINEEVKYHCVTYRNALRVIDYWRSERTSSCKQCQCRAPHILLILMYEHGTEVRGARGAPDSMRE